jgi:4-carboxymuconolactone decarboxylase
MLGRSIGLSKEKVENLREWKTSDVYSVVEKLVLEYTEAVVNDIRISDDLYSRLSEHFTPSQIIVLCVTTGVSGIINRIHGTFLTEVESATTETGSVKESVSVLINKPE